MAILSMGQETQGITKREHNTMNYGNYQAIVEANKADIQRVTTALALERAALRVATADSASNSPRGLLRLPWFGGRTIADATN
jgi:hypothetical protein